MPPILVPWTGPESWRLLLADPEKHWARRYSARTLAHCWESADGFPVEVRQVLSQHSSLDNAEALLIAPEWKVPLPGGARPSQNDVWVLARTNEGLVSVAVEGKVSEPFDKTVGEWRADASPGRDTRLAYLRDVLGLKDPIPDSVRYQLLHRTASAVIEAERFCAKAAAMIVHSFSADDLWFDDFARFASLFGLGVEIGKLASTTARGGMPLHIAWVRGDHRFLEA